MSTRCQVLVEGSDVLVYRHSDGYPDGPHGVLKALKPIVAKFVKNRGHDECYLPAHIISGFIAAHVKWCDKAIRECKREGRDASGYEQAKFLGHGLDAYDPATGAGLHGDIEFLYVVKKNGTIEVRACEWGYDDPCKLETTKLIKAVKYAPRRKAAAK